jgi:ankyrin repeat protein
MRALVLAALAAATLSAAHAPLAEAIKAGRRAAALELLAQRADVNAAEADGSTPLLWAAHLDDVDLVAQLLRAGANPNVKNRLGASPLSEAAFNANTQIVKLLLEAGADPNLAGPDGQTPLMLIARTANLEAARLLLAKGADPNAKESQRQQTALMWAAAWKQGPMVRLLLEAGARPNERTWIDMLTPLVSSEPRAQPRTPGGMTALLFATREGCLECVQALLEHGAKIDQPDPEGITPLISALFNAHFDVAKYLIEHGANINRWDWWGRTPLYLAVDYNTLPHGGRPDQPSLDETLPLDIVRMLLERGADPNPQLKLFPPYRATGPDRGADGMLTIGATPLLRAAKAQDVEAVRLLLEHGASLELANSQGMVPILAAAGIGSAERDSRGNYRALDIQERAIETFRVMQAHGADLTARAGRQQQAPLHGAAMWGWTKVIQFLLDQGADINVADARGLTPLDYAMGRGAPNGRGEERPAAAEFILAKGGRPGTPVPQPGGRPGGPAR